MNDNFDVSSELVNKDKEIETLLESLYNANVEIVLNASEALILIGERAIPGLIAILEDNYKYLIPKNRWEVLRVDSAVFQACYILEKIGSPSVPALINVLQKGPSEARRKSAIALGIIKDNSAIEPLIQALKDGDALVRNYTIRALIKIGSNYPLTLFSKLAQNDPDAEVREEATKALFEITKDKN